MARKQDPAKPVDQVERADDAGDPGDVEGHTFEYARFTARERAREADEWAKKEAIRKEARGLRDRLTKRG
jgi:hypothetical protein